MRYVVSAFLASVIHLNYDPGRSMPTAFEHPTLKEDDLVERTFFWLLFFTDTSGVF